MILGSFFGGRFPWHLLGSWVGVAWSCCALRFGIRGPMGWFLGVGMLLQSLSTVCPAAQAEEIFSQVDMDGNGE